MTHLHVVGQQLLAVGLGEGDVVRHVGALGAGAEMAVANGRVAGGIGVWACIVSKVRECGKAVRFRLNLQTWSTKPSDEAIRFTVAWFDLGATQVVVLPHFLVT